MQILQMYTKDYKEMYIKHNKRTYYVFTQVCVRIMKKVLNPNLALDLTNYLWDV